jgi:EF hand
MMMSAIGGSAAMGGMGRLPSLEQMQQMKARAFEKADADASGGLDKTEFQGLLQNSPMGKMGGPLGGADADQAFGRVDSDGNGTLTQAELDRGMQQMMQTMQSTLQAFGGGSAAADSGSKPDSLQTLLEALEAGQASGGEGASASPAMRELLQRLTDQLETTYGSLTADASRRDPLLSLAA